MSDRGEHVSLEPLQTFVLVSKTHRMRIEIELGQRPDGLWTWGKWYDYGTAGFSSDCGYFSDGRNDGGYPGVETLAEALSRAVTSAERWLKAQGAVSGAMKKFERWRESLAPFLGVA